jgi:Sap, sulfolipid-1-addressing protein
MGQVVLLSLTAALNPTLVAASTVMMLLPRPVRLMSGYLVGALMTSITLGIVILLTLNSSGAVSTVRHTLSPAADIALGALALVIALGLRSLARHDRLDRPHRREREKKDPRWKKAMSKGSARTTFVIGAVLTLPGASYLAGLTSLYKLHYSTAVDILIIIGFNIVMLVLLEVPLACFVVAPEWTPGAIERAKAWIGERWPVLAARGLALIGLLLILKGVIGLV